MQKIKRLDKSAVQDNLVIIFACLMFIMQMFIYSSTTWDGWHDKIYLTGMISEIVLVFVAIFGKKTSGIEIKCLVLYMFWLIISRFFNRDTTLVKSVDHLRIVIVCVSVICCGMALEKDKRKKALDIISVLICSFYFVLSLAGIYSAATRTDVNLPFGIAFTLFNQDKTHYFQIMTCRNRNLTSAWFAISCCLVLYQMAACKKKILVVPLALIAISLYTVVGLSMSRGSMVALCIALAMFFMLLADKKLINGKKGKRIIILALIALISLPVFYKGFGLTSGIIDSAHNVFMTARGDEAIATDDKAAIVDEGSEKKENANDIGSSFSDPRDMESVVALGGRVDNWKSAIAAIRIEPHRLIKGGIIGEYMLLPDLLNQREGRSAHYVNMHNYLVDTLMLSGLPGLALMLLFTALIVLRMIKVFFANGIDFAVKALTIPIAASFVKNMMETIIFNNDDITNFLFCFIAGIFLAYSYELLPAKKPETGITQPEQNSLDLTF